MTPMIVLFFAVTLANVWLFFASDRRDSYQPSTFKSLYVPSDVPLLARTWILESGKAKLRIDS